MAIEKPWCQWWSVKRYSVVTVQWKQARWKTIDSNSAIKKIQYYPLLCKNDHLWGLWSDGVWPQLLLLFCCGDVWSHLLLQLCSVKGNWKGLWALLEAWASEVQINILAFHNIWYFSQIICNILILLKAQNVVQKPMFKTNQKAAGQALFIMRL